MISKRVVFLLCTVCTLAAAANKDEQQPVAAISVDPPNPPKPTTTIKPTTSSTTIAPTTTNGTTTPASTTSSSTTPSSTTSSSTAPTTKPTTPAPTPKPTPDKPAVNEYVGNYTGTNKICLMVKLAIQVEVWGKDNSSTMLNVTEKMTYDTECATKDQEKLTVKWATNNSISFGFFKNNSRYEIHSINATVLLAGEKNVTTFYHIKPEFSVSDKMSYYCIRDQPLNMTDDKTNVTLAKVHLSHVQYQAFMNTTEHKYGNVWDCDGANTPDVVPVVVGCVLAVLVVLVLVVYLFGRRRCQARGYLSM